MSDLLQRKLAILNSAFDSYSAKPQQVPENGELTYKCVDPRCSSHAKRRNKLCINIFKESAHCWNCGGKFKNIGNLIAKYSNQNYEEWRNISDKKLAMQPASSKSKKYYDSSLYEMIPIANLSNSHRARIYLNSRDVSLEKAMKFNLHFCENNLIENKILKNYICVPSHSFEGIDYLFFRSVQDRFKMNTNSEKKRIIFNDLFINWNKPITLVEGVFDALRMWDFQQAIPLMGSSLAPDSALFEKIVKFKPKIIVCLDPVSEDNDIERKKLYIFKLLRKWNIETYTTTTTRTDIAASTNEELLSAINNVEIVDFDSLIQKGINAR